MFHMAISDFRQSARTRSAGLKRLIWLAVFVLAISSLAGEPWDKRPQQWNLAETYQILSDSPWSPSKTAVELTFEKRYIDPLTNRHWQVITFCREDAAKVGLPPGVRRIAQLSGVAMKELYALFPKGPGKLAARISGLPKPQGCI